MVYFQTKNKTNLTGNSNANKKMRAETSTGEFLNWLGKRGKIIQHSYIRSFYFERFSSKL